MPFHGEAAPLAFLEDGGDMGALMRVHDWSRSPLGAPASWPDTLKGAVATCLASRFPMVIWWGPQLLMLYNDAWQPILGETKHPAGLGRPGAESWPETWPIVGVQFENALRGVANWSEDLLLASDRQGFLEECYFTYSHSPLRDASGDVVGVQSIVSETTARVLNERRLRSLRDVSNATLEATKKGRSLARTSRRLLDVLCAGNPDIPFAVLYWTGADGIARLGAAAGIVETLFPAEASSTAADPWGIGAVLQCRSRVLVDHAPAMSDPLPGGAWPEPTTQLMALPLCRDRGTGLRGVLLVGINSRLRLDQPYTDYLGLVAARLAGAMSTLQLFEDERAARADAERAARIKDEFLAILSHELRTPLNAVIGWAQILRLDVADPRKVAAAAAVIERNAQLQARLISDLLDISRITAGNLRLEQQPVALPAVLQAAVESAMPGAAAKAITVAGSLPPAARPVRGDAARIQQMVGNLLSNAVKFTPRGGHVQVAIVSMESHVEIRVQDDGEGIDPAFLPSLFERFRQADSSPSRRHGGLGLGLTIVKHLAELHGGRVRAASEGRGRGACFVVELPFAADGMATVEGGAAPAAAAPASLQGIRVLVVDDDLDALAMLQRLLGDGSNQVLTASTATTALDLVARGLFDVIVSDIGMPGRDGHSFIADLRSRGIRTPAIALTAFAHAEDVRKALAAGYQVHLPKPVDTPELLRTIARLASRPGT
jgi:signal transduction histidine kinase